jgi:hypothetical protein
MLPALAKHITCSDILVALAKYKSLLTFVTRVFARGTKWGGLHRVIQVTPFARAHLLLVFIA